MTTKIWRTRDGFGPAGWLVVFWLSCGIAYGGVASLIGNGSFEGGPVDAGPRWQENGSFWQGGGRCAVTTEEACHGRRSLRISATLPRSQGQVSSGEFYLIPDQRYRVSYCMKRSHEQVDGRLSLEFSDGTRSGAFVCHARDKAIGTWQQVGRDRMNILFFLPAGSNRKYVVLKDGIFSVPSAIYGRKPVRARGKLYVQGLGDVFFDQVIVEALGDRPTGSEQRLGFADAGQEEARILLLDAQSASNARKAATGPGRESYKLELPPSFPLSPLAQVDASAYPPCLVNTRFHGARVERFGKPVFLLGAEFLSPYLCKLLGMDFWVLSAFGNKVEARLEGQVVKTSLTKLPFLEEQVREHLKGGILVWMDLLQDYKAWHSKLLLDHFPSLFVTREGFFCWRPEEPRAQALRHATWHNAVKKTGRYPVFVYELFNELNYEDHSPYNYAGFRRKMAAKYGTISRANRLWGTSFASFAEVVPPGNDTLLDAVTRISPQLKAEWSLFTEERLADIARESVAWLRQLVPSGKLSLQSYNGLPFDYQNNHVNPYLVNPSMDVTIGEFDQAIYPQWEGAENEEEIVSSMRHDMNVSISRLSARDQVLLDGECRFGAMPKLASAGNIVVDLNGSWLFRSGAEASEAQVRSSGYQSVDQEEDRGLREGWQRTDLDTSAWHRMVVPGMWGQQGFPRCYVGWYRRTFTVPKDASRLYLSGQKLSDRAEIYVNGKLLHRTLAWNEPFSLDLTDLVNREGDNSLCIRIVNSYFEHGHFYGGIRDNLRITNVPLVATPITPEQLAFGLGLRAFQGYGGLCLSYFYINWMEDWSCSIMNPEKFQPEAVASLPAIKNRLNDLAPLIYRTRHEYRDVAVTYSLNSARSYVPKNSAIPRERTFDIARFYCGSVFTQRGTDVVSDDVLEDYGKMRQFKALIICRTEAVSVQALKNIRRFAEEGGLVLVDRLSLVKNSWDGSPLDASELLGVVRGPVDARPAQRIRVEGLDRTFETVGSRMADGGRLAPLEIRNARVFAWSGDTIVGAVRSVGRGRIVTFTPELRGSDYALVFRQLFAAAGISPELEIAGGTYVETHVRQKDGRHLWAVFNRGKDAWLTIAGEVPEGDYQVREGFSAKVLPTPAGLRSWTAGDIRRGIRIFAPNLSPIYLLIEPQASEKISLTTLPQKHQEALKTLFMPLWQEMSHPKKRVLWYGYTHYAPTMLPTAAKVMRNMGVAVDFMADRAFSPELKVIRGGKRVVEKLNAYDLIVIPRSRNKLTEEDCKGLKGYLEKGGNLLLLAGHVYNFHSFYNHRMTGIVKMLKLRVVESGLEDASHQRDEEIRRFNTSNLVSHPVTAGVRTFAVMGATGVAIPGGTPVVLAEDTAKASGGLSVILTVRETEKNRIVLCGDADWLSPEGLVLADNAKLWSNVVGWLCNLKPLTVEQARKCVELPEL